MSIDVRGLARRRGLFDERLHVLISPERLRKRVLTLARRISRDYRGKEIDLVGVLKGSFVFMADLARQIEIPLTCDFLRVSSYDNATESSGTVRLEFDTTQPVQGKHVLLIEDIVDTGLTMQFILKTLRARRPKSLKVCALLVKPARAQVKVPVDYLGFQIQNYFAVGYGLDYAGHFRNLPFIAALREPPRFSTPITRPIQRP